MNRIGSKTPAGPTSSFDVSDGLYALFKYKWLVLMCGLGGVAAAAGFYLASPKIYESRAKLFVRYVMDRNPVDSVDSPTGTGTRMGVGVMDSEVQILTSWDLAIQVADAMAAETGENPDAGKILENLEVIAPRDSNVLEASFKSDDPERARRTLDELVKVYFVRHLEIHRSAGAFEFVSQQTERMRLRLQATEEALRELKSEAGIVTIWGSKEALTERLAATEQDLLSADALVAEQKARVKEIERWETAGADESESSPAPTVDSATVQRYKALILRLAEARKAEFEVLGRYTPGSRLAVQAGSRIEDVERQVRRMEQENPTLMATGAAMDAGLGRPDLMSERAALAAAEARAAALTEQKALLGQEAGSLSTLGVQMDALERRRELEETSFKYFESSLERARVDEALDPSKIPNISIVQAPSPAFLVTGRTTKIALVLAAGGWAFGLALALGRGMLLDRSIKRPTEIETLLGISPIAAIPNLVPGREKSHFLRAYGEALGNRLIHLFESEQMTHKPKMVGVTSCAAGAGVSTIAGSLAAALSETGEGKVLLVNIQHDNAEARSFRNGQPVGTLSDALDSGGQPAHRAPDMDNLYLASTAPNDGDSLLSSPKTLYKMLPRFRASQFDYIIFDLPPVGQLSPTQMIAGFLDRVILVVEAEKTDREIVQRAGRELAAAKAQVVGLINRVRQRVPTWIEATA